MMRHIACGLLLATTATGCHKPDDYLLGPSQADQVLSVTLSATTAAGGRDLARHDHRPARSAHRRRQAGRDVHHDGRHAHRRRQGRPVDHGSGRHQREGRCRVAELHHAGNGPARRDGGLGLAHGVGRVPAGSRAKTCSTCPSAARRFRRMASRRPSSRSRSNGWGRSEQRAIKFETSAGTAHRVRADELTCRDDDGGRDGTGRGGAAKRDSPGSRTFE